MFVSAFWRVAGGSLAAALVVVSFAAGCSSHRPEKNPYLVEKFEEIDETLSDLKTLQRDIAILQDDLAFFNDEIKQIKAMKGGLTPKEREQIAAATAKIAEFEKLTANLDRVKADLAAVEAAPASTRQVVASTAPKSVTPAESVKPPSAPAASVKPPAATAATSTAKTPPSAPAAQSSARRGYYTVKSGESLSVIAKRNGISIGSLAKANNLPSNAGLAIGQRIWIP